MKAIFLLILFIAILNPIQSSAFTGGVSGGGGHVINPTTPDVYQDPEIVEEMVKCTVKPVQAYLLKKNADYKSGTLPTNQMKIFGKIFSTPFSIHEALKKVKMDVADEQSCYDHENQPVDGSIFHQNKKQVCISAKNIAHKVHFNEVKAQSGALIIHEYTEIIGLNEEDALEVQKISLDEFKKNPISHHGEYSEENSRY